jgi:hypothetical protein
MKRRLLPYRWLSNRLGKAGALAVVVALVCASAALAFYLVYGGAAGVDVFTNNGTGGAAGDGQSTAAIVLNADPPTAVSGGGSCSTSNLGPGCTWSSINVWAQNANPNAAEVLNTVTPTVYVGSTGVTGTVGPNGGQCLASWITASWGGSLISLPSASMPVGSAWSELGQLTLSMPNLPSTDQTGCSHVPIVLGLTGTTSP